jgi:hypothetical protein
VVHGHCHHKAIMKMEDEFSILDKLGLDVSAPETGCCGMAGAFGFEAGDHYDVSIKAGERVLLPAVREAEKDTLIIADGFSCREQISQPTDRQALHLAEVLRMALDDGPSGPSGEYPEAHYASNDHAGGLTRGQAVRTAALAGGAALAAGGALWWGIRRRG